MYVTAVYIYIKIAYKIYLRKGFCQNANIKNYYTVVVPEDRGASIEYRFFPDSRATETNTNGKWKCIWRECDVCNVPRGE